MSTLTHQRRAALVQLANWRVSPRRLWKLFESDLLESTVAQLRRGVDSRGIFRGDPDWTKRIGTDVSHLDDSTVSTPRNADAGDVEDWVSVVGEAQHLECAIGDTSVPPVLFWRGARRWNELAGSPVVGIIGTRRASRYGLEVAGELGWELAKAGVCVASGLAAGIDGAAHVAALAHSCETEPSPGVFGVIGTGVDRWYPARHRQLHIDVARFGAICSPFPAGTGPTTWGFPLRNAVLAAACDVVIVVESGRTGGSMITVDVALDRNVVVMAVPGSIRSRSSEGTNRLLADGAHPCLGIDDVIEVLTMLGRTPSVRSPVVSVTDPGDDVAADTAPGWVFEELQAGQRSMSELMRDGSEAGYTIAEISQAVVLLKQRCLAHEDNGVVFTAPKWSK